MQFAKEIIYSDWSTSKWLFKIEEVFCPLEYLGHKNCMTDQTEFLNSLKSNKIYFLSSFTEIIGTTTKKAKTALSQLILTSDKIYSFLINVSKIKIMIENLHEIRKLYLQILSIIESLLDDCEKLNEKLLRELPLTKYASFIGKGLFKKNVEIVKLRFVKASLSSVLIQVVVSSMLSIVQRIEIKRGELKYAQMLLSKLLNIENPTAESVEDLLIQYDFNSPEYFNYLGKQCTNSMLQNTSLHFQMELLISLEDRLNELPFSSSWRFKIEDESIREQIKAFYREKKDNIKQRIELRRAEILDSKLWEENDRSQINLPVPQIGLFIRLFMERGIIPKEDIGKTFSYYAKHFRTPNTSFISAESLQKKSLDVEFSTAKKIKGHLIGMVNWLNENYNTSNYNDL
ncbi:MULTISPECIES: hypothetical protein [Sphingobacterium]|uniref:hypothetical protein n=1 Tax=Sphingobacterium TaxID=28453 RepID=UPI00257F2487|nr:MULTISPECIES: hypothetical protein [Sphingobacterium]